IRRLRPDLFVKGAEFRDAEKDHSGHILVEEQAVRSVGGRLAFTDDPVFSSSNLINRYLSGLPDATRDYLDQFRQRYSAGRIIDLINGAQKLSVLVVGETIIDEYQYCQAIGKSSKEPVLAVKQNGYEKFAGGILAVGNHV